MIILFHVGGINISDVYIKLRSQIGLISCTILGIWRRFFDCVAWNLVSQFRSRALANTMIRNLALWVELVCSLASWLFSNSCLWFFQRRHALFLYFLVLILLLLRRVYRWRFNRGRITLRVIRANRANPFAGLRVLRADFIGRSLLSLGSYTFILGSHSIRRNFLLCLLRLLPLLLRKGQESLFKAIDLQLNLDFLLDLVIYQII